MQVWSRSLALSFVLLLLTSVSALEPKRIACVERAPEARPGCLADWLTGGGDGTAVVTWRDGSGTRSWQATVAVDEDRAAAEAAALVEAGHEADARTLIALAAGLGAAGPVVDLWNRLGGGAIEGVHAPPVPLEVGAGYEPLPDAEVELLDGGKLALSSARGDVLVLEFWAVWCPPCKRELPWLQRLQEAEGDKGLKILAINVGDERAAIDRYRKAMNLDLAVGVQGRELFQAFRVESLPTLIVADRQGRLRARWNGFREGMETKIETLIRSLLENRGDRKATVAETFRGPLPALVWSREGRARVDALALVASSAGRPGALYVRSGNRLVRFDENGLVVAELIELPDAAAGVLRIGDVDGDGEHDLFGFRRGGPRLVRIDPEDQQHVVWTAPSPVLDLQVLPAAGSAPPAVLLATVDGLHWLDGSGVVKRSALPGVTIVSVGRAGEAEVVALTDKGQLYRVGFAGEVLATATGIPGSRVVGGETGAALLPVKAGGAVLNEAGGWLVVAGPGEQLVVMDSADGTERFRASWPGIGPVAAGDLDGDGAFELAIASGTRLTVIRPEAPKIEDRSK